MTKTPRRDSASSSEEFYRTDERDKKSRFWSARGPISFLKCEFTKKKKKKKSFPPKCRFCKWAFWSRDRTFSVHLEPNRCKGKGRTNYVDLGMQPRGEWPKWCRACGGRGFEYCSRCLRTGEYRYIMGFKFMKPDTNENGGRTGYLGEEENAHRRSSDRILNNDEPRQRS